MTCGQRKNTPHELRGGGHQLDDETLWSALLGALDEARGDRELWLLADGFVTESVLLRRNLGARMKELCRTNASAAEMARMMADPRRNAWGYDPNGNRDYWASLVPPDAPES